jgi:arylsulfatase A-like enzyme
VKILTTKNCIRLALLLLVAASGIYARESTAQEVPTAGPPNVLLIHVDDLNDWVLRPAGHPRPITPNLDRLMGRAVSFTNAHAVVPVCGPSRKCLYSGWYPQTMNDWNFGDWAKTSGLRRAVPMPLHFRNHGYLVYGSGKLLHEGRAGDFWTEYGIGPDYGPWPWRGKGPAEFTPHPDQYAKWIHAIAEPIHRDLNYAPLSQVPVWPPSAERGWPGADGWFRAADKPFRYASDENRDPTPDEIVSAWAAEILSRKHDRPFFVGAGLIRPHTPLYAPQRYFDLFPIEKITLPPYLTDDLADCAPALRNRWPWGFQKYEGLIKVGGQQAWKQWVQAYLACIAFADDQIGRMLDALDSGPNRDNTIVLLTGDNGYHLGEKNCIQKWHLWEESTHVPLIVQAPRMARGRACDQPVSHIDIYPTLVDLCGLPDEPHAATGGAALDGHSLRPLLANPEHGTWSGPPVALMSVDDANLPKDTNHHYSVRSKRYRYTLCADGDEELYDHQGDPHEWTNRATDPSLASVKAELRAELEKLVRAPQANE